MSEEFDFRDGPVDVVEVLGEWVFCRIGEGGHDRRRCDAKCFSLDQGTLRTYRPSVRPWRIDVHKGDCWMSVHQLFEMSKMYCIKIARKKQSLCDGSPARPSTARRPEHDNKLQCIEKKIEPSVTRAHF